MLKSKMTRRRFLAAASTAAIAMPYVRGAHAAGTLSIGFWDHWVPGANKASQALCEEWAAKEKVDVSIDYITSQGNKNLLTIAAEAQARSGHDILAFPTWQPADQANRLEPVDDIMAELIKQNGAVNPTVEYLGKSGGRWIAVPAAVGSQIKGPCSRIDLMKKYAGIDVQVMYPAGSPPKGTLYHYPNPHNHQILSVAAQPAPPKIAVQIYTQAIQTKMVVRFMQGEPLEQTLAWAETEVEGFMRT